MTLEADAIRGVKTWYGVQDLSQSEARSLNGAGNVEEKVVVITGKSASDVSFTLPKGAIIIDSFVEVVEAFDLTADDLSVGVSGSEATNSIVDLAEADAEAIGTYQGVPAGTLAAGTPLAADAVIAVDSTFGDTSGKAYVHFRYRSDKR